MNPVLIHEKAELAAFLGKYPQLNYYHIGDLGVHYWPFTTWYAYKEAADITGNRQSKSRAYAGIGKINLPFFAVKVLCSP